LDLAFYLHKCGSFVVLEIAREVGVVTLRCTHDCY